MLFSEQKPDLRLINPLTLAFIGDGVYELMAREEVIRRFTSLSAKRLHAVTVELVRATAQCRAFEMIEGALTESELLIFKRGRNAGGVTPPKHTPVAQYRTATGVEALFGWLYLSGESQRLRELFAMILDGEYKEEDLTDAQKDTALL